MSGTAIEQAIAALRRLSAERQEELAAYIYQLAVDERQAETIDPAHLPAVQDGLDQVARGQLATPERVAEAFRRFEK
jgi:hypothetical protein